MNNVIAYDGGSAAKAVLRPPSAVRKEHLL